MNKIPFDYRLAPSAVLSAWTSFGKSDKSTGVDSCWPVLLESARFHPQRGRYSYFAAEPLQTWTLPTVSYGDDPFRELRDVLPQEVPAEREFDEKLSAKKLSDEPPFQGGLIGLLSYELGHCWERLPQVPADDFTTPALVVGAYGWCLCWDHLQQQAWVLSSAENVHRWFDTEEWSRRIESVVERLRILERQYAANITNIAEHNVESSHETRQTAATDFREYPVSSRLRAEYLTEVERVIEYIRAGDIYQANLSRKLHFPFAGSPQQLYQELRNSNPAPFAAYFQPATDWALVSASPEQFLQVEGRTVSTRPIKGTRPRWQAGDLDLLQGAELQSSEKDRAENTMIVDLLRNDLSKVCEIGTVRVPRWCELETFEKVHHLVSEVTGHLRSDANLWDLLAATFPGGSITGAPKIRAMEIISELEGTARGCYCGSLFAAGWNGSLQSSILIRTLLWKQGWVQCPVGGGIVADSLPANEYDETVHKSAGLIFSEAERLTP